MGSFVRDNVLRSWTRVATTAAVVLTALVATVAVYHHSSASTADGFVGAADNTASTGAVSAGSSPALAMLDAERWRTVLDVQELYYQEKIRARDDWMSKEKVGGTQNIWFMYEPLWWCPYGQQLLGKHGDGVKWICGVPLMALRPSREDYQTLVEAEKPFYEALLRGGPRVRPPCVVYSAGSNRNSIFEDELKARTNCEIHIFDPSEKGPAGWGKGFGDWNAKYSYHATKIGGTPDGKTMTFSQVLDKLGNKWVDIFKIDIEKAELEVIKQLTPAELSKIGQILVEVHSPTYKQNFEFFSKLEANGFRIYSKEVNVLSPPCAEYALINTAWSPEYGFEDAEEIGEDEEDI